LPGHIINSAALSFCFRWVDAVEKMDELSLPRGRSTLNTRKSYVHMYARAARYVLSTRISFRIRREPTVKPSGNVCYSQIKRMNFPYKSLQIKKYSAVEIFYLDCFLYNMFIYRDTYMHLREKKNIYLIK